MYFRFDTSELDIRLEELKLKITASGLFVKTADDCLLTI